MAWTLPLRSGLCEGTSWVPGEGSWDTEVGQLSLGSCPGYSCRGGIWKVQCLIYSDQRRGEVGKRFAADPLKTLGPDQARVTTGTCYSVVHSGRDIRAGGEMRATAAGSRRDEN